MRLGFEARVSTSVGFKLETLGSVDEAPPHCAY